MARCLRDRSMRCGHQSCCGLALSTCRGHGVPQFIIKYGLHEPPSPSAVDLCRCADRLCPDVIPQYRQACVSLHHDPRAVTGPHSGTEVFGSVADEWTHRWPR